MATKKETEEKQTQAEEKANKETASSKAVAGDASEFDASQEIEELIKSMAGDLSSIEAESALSLVKQRYDFLHKFKEPEVKELASGLKELQKLLKSGKATGHEISEVLIHIGEQTSDSNT